MANEEQQAVKQCALSVFLVRRFEYMVDAGQRSVLFWTLCGSAEISIASIWPRLFLMSSIIRPSW